MSTANLAPSERQTDGTFSKRQHKVRNGTTRKPHSGTPRHLCKSSCPWSLPPPTPTIHLIIPTLHRRRHSRAWLPRRRACIVGCASLPGRPSLRDRADEIERQLPVATAVEPLEGLVEAAQKIETTRSRATATSRFLKQVLLFDSGSCAWSRPQRVPGTQIMCKLARREHKGR